MGRFAAKIDKLIQDLDSLGERYIAESRQMWNKKAQRQATLMTLYEDTQEGKTEIVSTFSEVDIVRELVRRWDKVTRHGRRIKRADRATAGRS